MYTLTITPNESEFLQTIVVEFEQNDPSERIEWHELIATQKLVPELAQEGVNLNLSDRQVRFLESVVFAFLQRDPDQTMSPIETDLARGLFVKITTAMKTEAASQPPGNPSQYFNVYTGPGPYLDPTNEDPLADPMSPGAFMS